MKYRVLWTEKAEADVEQILQWFESQVVPHAAANWHQNLLACIETLETHPERCGIVSELSNNGEIRELGFGRRTGRYRIFYRVKYDQVIILRLWHSARDTPSQEDIG